MDRQFGLAWGCPPFMLAMELTRAKIDVTDECRRNRKCGHDTRAPAQTSRLPPQTGTSYRPTSGRFFIAPNQTRQKSGHPTLITVTTPMMTQPIAGFEFAAHWLSGFSRIHCASLICCWATDRCRKTWQNPLADSSKNAANPLSLSRPICKTCNSSDCNIPYLARKTK